ncbi:MAG: DUF3089 domain-containing protein, partial [Solirubrobacterales bacterium]
MLTVELSRIRLLLTIIAASVAAALLIAPAASAEDTTWICKPGQADDLCAGTIAGESSPAPGQTAQPLPYTRPADAPIDCFYLYPTQSEQAGPNADLAKDPPIRRVVVQQARMFSSVCKVYAPMYRQVTLNGDQSAYNPSVETAYQSAKTAFEDYLKNYNDGRGFIMLGHSQGSAHTARLIHDLVDTDPELRQRFVGAMAPGANIAVPIGQAVGGYFQNVPACTAVGQYGCVIAYSTYKGEPGPSSEFSRLDAGYWIYPQPRFDAGQYEAMCTDPARLDGGNGTLLPLVNYDYLLDVPSGPEGDAPWRSQPDYYKVECKRAGTAHWLDISKTDLPGDSRLDLGALVASGNNYHVPEVNLAEGNLLEIAQLQSDNYTAEQARIAALQKKLADLEKKLAKAKKRKAKAKDQVADLQKAIRDADGAKERKALKRKLKAQRRKAKSQSRKI